MNSISLSDVCDYSEATTSVEGLTLSNFISTDNMMPNRGGIVDAVNLPPANSCCKFEEDDILLSNIRPYFKKIWHATFEGGCSNDVLVLKTKNKKFLPKFVYYSLFQDLFFKHMMNGAKGSKMPRGDQDQIMLFQIPEFEKAHQGKIADLLTLLDEKISLNNHINNELEAMAKTIFQYWFLQFDFPNQDGKPYNTSGGEMEWNEDLKREIPVGWKVKNIFDELEIQYGFPFDTAFFTDDKNAKPIVRIRDVLENTYSAFTTEDVDRKYALKENDLLIGMDGNFHMNFWAKNEGYLNQRSVRFRAKEKSTVSNFQIYFELSPYIKAIEKSKTRTTVGHLSDQDLRELFIMIPLKTESFNPKERFDNLLSLLVSNRKQNQELITFRDFILPLLMNGQVKVK
jgi:type I restriction enzyme S subunit